MCAVLAGLPVYIRWVLGVDSRGYYSDKIALLSSFGEDLTECPHVNAAVFYSAVVV